MFIVIAYDIVCHRRRQRLAKMLAGFGERVNYSVFECDLRPRQFASIQKKVEKLINLKEDRVRYYELCLDCQRRIQAVGQTATPPSDQSLVFV